MSILFNMLSVVNVCLIYVYSIGLFDNLITGVRKWQASVCVCTCMRAGVCICVRGCWWV